MFDTAHAQILATLALSGTTVLVAAAALVACGYVRDCSGQHAGAGPGATTVAHIQEALAAESAVPPKAPERHVGRHRSPEAYQYRGFLLGLLLISTLLDIRPATP